MRFIGLGANSPSDAGGYEVANSLRFDDGSTDYLRITPSSASNRTTFTFSTWIKRASSLGNFQRIFEVGADTTNRTYITFDADDKLEINHRDSGVQQVNLTTTAVFRDVSAWYHIVFAVDTTQGTDTNRIKIYVNGTQQTSLDSTVYPSSSKELDFNSTQNHTLGADVNGGNEFDGYMAEVVMIDGTALDATSFGEFDEDTGIWKPIDVSGLTFGTNGFYLDFENSGSLGADVSGNGNNFTVNNLTSIDQTTDTCTNNFATWNPLDKHASSTLSEGNLKYATSGTSQYEPVKCTIAFADGKWYSEHQINSLSTTACYIGIYGSSVSGQSQSEMDTLRFAYNVKSGEIIKNAGNIQTGNPTFTTNDILGIEVDLDNGTLKFYKNGTQVGTTVTDSDITNNEWVFGSQPRLATFTSNFGSPAITISSGNSDPDGYGNFEYSTGVGYALNTKNLAEYG
jgi:hypothetical protein